MCRKKTTRGQVIGWIVVAVLLMAIHHSVYAAQDDVIAKQAGASPIKVFILAGQSNMQGQGVADLDGPDYNGGKGTLNYVMKDPAKARLFKHLKGNQGCWTVTAPMEQSMTSATSR